MCRIPGIKKAGFPLLCLYRATATKRNPAITINVRSLIMKFDPQTVAQAEAFVNAIRAGKRAHMPALRFGQWQQFMTTVYAGLGLA